MRRGGSLLETIVVLTIIAIMVAMLFPAVMRVRASANRTVCRNNLRQIGLGAHLYHDAYKVLPHARTCPAPWQNGKDPLCLACNPANTYSSANEGWWCPYDNRPGSTVTNGLPGAPPAGSISPFVENSLRVFRCPDAIDSSADSPTQGKAFQVSYAINPEVGGKKLTDVGGLLVFEHDDLPVCRGVAGHFTAWPADPATKAQRHEPKRHLGQSNQLYYNGSVE